MFLIRQGSDEVEFSKCAAGEWNEKYHCPSDFFNVSTVKVVLLSYIETMCLLKRNLATMLPLKSKLSENFQGFNTIDGSIEMLKNS